MTVRVGCCGYPVSMKRYQEAFQLVELNNTFYQYPKDSALERWRRESPRDFEFAVKAHQDISHKHRLKLDLATEAFNTIKNICRILQARMLLVQTPGSFTPDQLGDAYEFFKKADREELTLVWETRGAQWEKTGVRDELRKVLEEVDVPHVTDPFRLRPVHTGGVAYFRLHGLGKQMYYYQYTDKELEELYNQIKPFNHSDREVYVLFNNLSMFDDAKRFMYFLEKREFPSLRESVGLDAVRAVIERTRYPLTRSMLMRKVGWKIIELEEGKQIRLEELLKDLPSRKYGNAEEVMEEITRKGFI